MLGHTSAEPQDPETISTPNARACSTADLGRARLRIIWWNVQNVAALWHINDFWDILVENDIVFLSETHHTDVPHLNRWHLYGIERAATESAPGGPLALVKHWCHDRVKADEHPFDGFLWLHIDMGWDELLWLGVTYIPGPTDPRFHRLQGCGHKDHFTSY